MTMKRIEVPWAPACEREETALPRTGPAKTKLQGSTRETHMEEHTYTQTKFMGSSRETSMEAHTHTHSTETQGKLKGNPH